MAELVNTDQNQNIQQVPAPFQGVLALPVVRIIGLLVGLAASIALGAYIFMWSQTPNYSVLYSQMSMQDATEIANVLDNAKIQYRLEPDSGALLVDSSSLNEAKLKIAEANLTPSVGTGFELMDKDSGFGTSSFIQTARYHRAQEGELARTITGIAAVQHARVHLALPKESAFLRDRHKASASVMLKLIPGRQLEKGQIAAITNLVAASVPNMEASQVTVVDSKGRLLSNDESNELALTASEFEHTSQVEKKYIERIERILTPIVGINSVRAQVSADIDFTRTEYTKESFNPDLPAIRSEQEVEEKLVNGVTEGGVPGAVANEPPADATAPEVVDNQADSTTLAPNQKGKSSRRSTRNYELDKTISHTQQSPGAIRRLSVAVVLDNKLVVNKDGVSSRVPYTPEEITRFTTLVKEAIGFNALRGDTVNVVNTAFSPIIEAEALPEIPIWKQPWVLTAAKQLAGILFVLFIAMKLLKLMQGLAKAPAVKVRSANGEGDELADDQLILGQGGTSARLPKPSSYEENLAIAKQVASQEPKRVAQVVKGWVSTELK